MAERQGLLTGLHLSPVQFRALVLLEANDAIKKSETETQHILTTLLQAGKIDPEIAFPVLKGVVNDDEADFADEEDAVTYVFSNAEYDPKKVEEEMRALMAEIANDSATFDEAATFTDWV